MAEQHNRLSQRNRGDKAAHVEVTGAARSGRAGGKVDRMYTGDRPGSGTVGFALAIAAGVAAIGLIGAQMRPTGSRTRTGPNRRTVAGYKPEVERSITIEDASADELYRRWRDPETLRRIMAPFADVQPTGDGQTRWSAGHDLGSWDMRLADDQPGEFMRWAGPGRRRSDPGSVRALPPR